MEAHRAAAPMRHALFTGCTALARRSALIDDAVFVAEAFGAPMGVARVSARCCGYPLYAAGAHEQFKLHAESFAGACEAYPELVVLDPGCAFTLKVVYPRFEVKLPSRIRTVYEVLAENLAHAPRHPPLEERAGYHDACHLGRGLGQYEEPRRAAQGGGGRGAGGVQPRAGGRAAPEAAGSCRAPCPTSRSRWRGARRSRWRRAARAW